MVFPIPFSDIPHWLFPNGYPIGTAHSALCTRWLRGGAAHFQAGRTVVQFMTKSALRWLGFHSVGGGALENGNFFGRHLRMAIWGRHFSGRHFRMVILVDVISEWPFWGRRFWGRHFRLAISQLTSLNWPF